MRDVVKVSAGKEHTIFLTASHDVYTVGKGESGTLGNGSFDDKTLPVKITGEFHLSDGEFIIDVGAGEYHCVAVSNTGRIFSFGSPVCLGLPTNVQYPWNTPLEINTYFPDLSGDTITMIECFDSATFILTESGRLFYFGDNKEITNGFDKKVNTYSPREFTSYFDMQGDEKIVKVFANASQVFFLTSMNSIFVYGNNYYCKLGISKGVNVHTPTRIDQSFDMGDGEMFESVAVGVDHTLLLTNLGNVFSFGNNDYGQLGLGDIRDYEIPETIYPINDLMNIEGRVTRIAAGLKSSFFATDKGKIYSCGNNDYFSLGAKKDIYILAPTDITNNFPNYRNEGIETIEVSRDSVFVLTKRSVLYAFGRNESGNLGNGKRETPKTTLEAIDVYSLLIGDEIVDLELGVYSGLLLTKKGKLFSFGGNMYGQLGISGDDIKNGIVDITELIIGNSPSTRIVQISMRDNSAFAVTSDGRVFSWGFNNSGNLGNGDTSLRSPITEVTANFLGMLPDEKIVYVETGDDLTFALSNRGRLYGIGYYVGNLFDLGNPVNTSLPVDLTEKITNLEGDDKIVSVSTNLSSIYILTSEGKLYVCGSNNHGQLFTWNNSIYQPLIEISGNFTSFKEGEKIIQVESSSMSGYILTNFGTAYSVGYNFTGMLGGWIGSRFIPLDITERFDSLSLMDKIVKIEAGKQHVIAMSAEGELYGFGDNYFKQLALPLYSVYYSPTIITEKINLGDTNDRIAQIEAGRFCSLVLTKSGRLYFSGDNTYAQMPTQKVEYTYMIGKASEVSQNELYSPTGYDIKLYLDSDLFKLDIAGGNGIGEFEYWSQNPAIASVDSDGVITPHKEGVTQITVMKYGDDDYLDSNTLNFNVVVNKNKPVDPEKPSPSIYYIVGGIVGGSGVIGVLAYIFIKKKRK